MVATRRIGKMNAAQFAAGRPQGRDFGMGRDVGREQHAVVLDRHHPIAEGNGAAKGRLACAMPSRHWRSPVASVHRDRSRGESLLS